MIMELHEELSASTVAWERVRDLYEAKSASILHRYGPGPRVHYHTGFVDDLDLPTTPAGLRACLVESQERMLRYAADVWQLGKFCTRNWLDVGCGLGGASIFMAQEFGAHLTAITIAPSHIELISRFARQAGVESLVKPIVCEAAAVPGRSRFDAAFAIESSSLFAREPWFRCLARVMRAGSRVFVFDCFLVRNEYEAPFNRHWCAQIGTESEYVDSARAAGFFLAAREDTSLRTATFWKTSAALIRAEVEETQPDPVKLPAIEESCLTHEVMRRGLLEGGLRQLNLTFIKAN